MIDCHQADFIDGCRRLMGTVTDLSERLARDHAVRCQRSDWWHALSPNLIAGVLVDRVGRYGDEWSDRE